MDRERVLRAWECCNPFNRKCNECPYEKDCYHDGISRHMVADAIALLKEQDERLRKLQKDKDKLCLEISEWKHKFHDRQIKEQDGIIPYIDIDEAKCPVCKVKLTRQELLGEDVLFEDFFDYCPHCGKSVLWEGR